MKQSKTRTLSTVVAAIVIVAALAFGPISCGTGTSRPSTSTTATVATKQSDATYTFRTNKLLKEHYEKHGKAMGFANEKDYEAAASAVVTNPNSLHKLEKEDGDDVYYLEATDEFVIVSPKGYIRTYFNPGGIDYFNRQ